MHRFPQTGLRLTCPRCAGTSGHLAMARRTTSSNLNCSVEPAGHDHFPKPDAGSVFFGVGSLVVLCREVFLHVRRHLLVM